MRNKGLDEELIKAILNNLNNGRSLEICGKFPPKGKISAIQLLEKYYNEQQERDDLDNLFII